MPSFKKALQIIGLLILFALFCILLVKYSAAADQYQNVYTPFVAFRNIPWGNGAIAVNNTFWFNSLAPEMGTCIVVYNNNPTNSHTYTLAVASASDPATGGFTGFAKNWTAVSPVVSTTFPVTVTALGNNAIFYATRSSAFIAMTFSATATAAGSPDTANIIAVQSANSTSCANSLAQANQVQGLLQDGTAFSNGSNNPIMVAGGQENGNVFSYVVKQMYVDAGTNGLLVGKVSSSSNDQVTPAYISTGYSGSVNPAIMTAGLFASSDDTSSPGELTRVKATKKYGLMVSNSFAYGSGQNTGSVAASSYSFSQDFVNPAAGALLFAQNQTNIQTNTATSLYRIVASCSAACDVIINRTSTGGSACTAATIHKAGDESSQPASVLQYQTGPCTTVPTVINQIFHLFLAANTPYALDTNGYWQFFQGGSTHGFDVVQGAALTGTISISVEFGERSGTP